MFNIRVIMLIMLSFVLGTCEYVVIGILPNIAEDLNVSITQTGLLISAFAIVYSVGAPLITAYLSRFPRYRTVLSLMFLFTLGNVACMLAPNYPVMLASRIFLAAVSSALISMSMTFAPDVAPRKYTSSVISWIFAGFNIASVFGVPFSMFIVQFASWRVAFAFIVVVSILLLLLMIKFLPTKNLPPTNNIMEQLVLLKDRRILMAVSAMILSGSSAYCFYTYLSPILLDKMGLSANLLTLAFVIFGVAAMISNLLSPMLNYWGGMRILWMIFAGQAIFSILLAFTMESFILGSVVICCLGVLMYLLNTPTQMYYLQVSKKFYPGTLALAGSLTSSSYNVGIAVGSFAGSLSVDLAGLNSVGITGGVFAILATIISYLLASRIKREYKEVIVRAMRMLNK
jgi:DHA1 family inner membrane transport protein